MRRPQEDFDTEGEGENRPYTSWPRSAEVWEVAKRRGLATDEGSRKIGEHVALLRKKRGITQVEMADLLGVSQPIVSKYESGELRLHAELLVRLTEILRVPIETLLKPGTPAPTPKKRGPPGRLFKAFEAASSLPKRQQQLVEQFVSTLLAQRKAG